MSDEEAPRTTQDQGPYTGQSLDIPEAPYDPVGDMDPADVAEQLAANQSGEEVEPDDDDE